MTFCIIVILCILFVTEDVAVMEDEPPAAKPKALRPPVGAARLPGMGGLGGGALLEEMKAKRSTIAPRAVAKVRVYLVAAVMTKVRGYLVAAVMTKVRGYLVATVLVL